MYVNCVFNPEKAWQFDFSDNSNILRKIFLNDNGKIYLNLFRGKIETFHFATTL